MALWGESADVEDQKEIHCVSLDLKKSREQVEETGWGLADLRLIVEKQIRTYVLLEF